MKVNDRVKQITNAIGLVDYSLVDTVTSFETFADSFNDGDEIPYACISPSQYEIGLGTFTSATNTLSRDTIINSTTGSKIDWPAGNKTIICSVSSSFVPLYGTVDPTQLTNASMVGQTYINTAKGAIFVCSDNTTNNTVWVTGIDVGTTIALIIALS